MIMPFKSGNTVITSPFGSRILYGASQYHSGLDMYSQTTKEIVSVCDGTVLWSQMVTDKNNPTWQWGNYAAINGIDGNTVYYCHMDKRLVKRGDKIKAGDVIGIMGNTGYSFGAHLHFEVRPNNASITNAADYLHLPNATTTISEKEYYSDEVCKACGFTEGTRAYINKYAWAPDLWRKLAFVIEHRHGKALTRAEIIKSCGFLPHTVRYIDSYTFANDFYRKVGEQCK